TSFAAVPYSFNSSFGFVIASCVARRFSSFNCPVYGGCFQSSLNIEAGLAAGTSAPRPRPAGGCAPEKDATMMTPAAATTRFRMKAIIPPSNAWTLARSSACLGLKVRLKADTTGSILRVLVRSESRGRGRGQPFVLLAMQLEEPLDLASVGAALRRRV